jgi:LysM repeat protein
VSHIDAGDESDDAPSEPEYRGKAHPDCDHRMPLWEHEVQPGEHLGLIAGRYGVRRLDLAALNPDLANPDLIRPGQKIRVCPEIAPRLRKQVTYVVEPGDTLSEIAHAHGLTVAEVLEAQGDALSNPNHLRAGRELVLWLDGGLVEAFQPPPPRRKGSSGSRATRRYTPVRASLSASSEIYIKRPHLAFGTTKTIHLIETAVQQYKRRHRRGPKVHIGDISKRGGGVVRPHLSHRHGRDVDIGYVLEGSDGDRVRFSGVNRGNLDLARTWALVKAFLDTHQVQSIFMDYGHQQALYEYAKAQGVSTDELDELFQYPRGRGRGHGIVRHWRSHKHHFHVRFKP